MNSPIDLTMGNSAAVAQQRSNTPPGTPPSIPPAHTNPVVILEQLPEHVLEAHLTQPVQSQANFANPVSTLNINAM
jgi:hypothetical protein